MKILNSNKLNRRFMKDTKMKSSYVNKEVFKERLELFEEEHQSKTKYKEFIEVLESFEEQKEYFDYVAKTMKDVVDFLKKSDNYKKLLSLDLKKLRKEFEKVPGKTLFKDENINKTYITFDLNKANYQILKKMSKENNILVNSKSYEDFLSNFTKFEYLKKSKSFRQAILGQVNPKRNQTVQRVILGKAMKILMEKGLIVREDVKLLSNDELTFIAPKVLDTEEKLKNIVSELKEELGYEFSYEKYDLLAFKEIDGYVKKHYYRKEEVKSMSKFLYPAYLKVKKGIPVKDIDLYFLHEGLEAQFVNIPSFNIKE